MPLFF